MHWGPARGSVGAVEACVVPTGGVEVCYAGPPIRQAARGPDGGRRFAYRDPLPCSGGGGSTPHRGSAVEAAGVEPMEAGPLLAASVSSGGAFNPPSGEAGGALRRGVGRFGVSFRASHPWTGGLGGGLGGVGRKKGGMEAPWTYILVVTAGLARCIGEIPFEEWPKADAARWERLEDWRGRRLRLHCTCGTPCHTDR